MQNNSCGWSFSSCSLLGVDEYLSRWINISSLPSPTLSDLLCVRDADRHQNLCWLHGCLSVAREELRVHHHLADFPLCITTSPLISLVITDGQTCTTRFQRPVNTEGPILTEHNMSHFCYNQRRGPYPGRTQYESCMLQTTLTAPSWQRTI